MKTLRTTALMALVGTGLVAMPVQAGIFDKLKSVFSSSDDGSTGNVSDIAKSALSNDDMIGALKDALKIGAGNVVSQLGSTDGFWKDDAIRIGLPGPLQKVDKTLSKFGMGNLTDGVRERVNRAAEAAVPEARDLFVAAISDMSIEDAAKIVKGPNDSATQYFREKMTPNLRAKMAPIITSSLDQVGAISAADNAVSKLPFGKSVPNLQEEMTDHVLDGALNGVFHYMAKEEAAIRENPAKQTTKLLKKVFS